MEPITIALSAFSAVKAGIAAGNEVSSLIKPLAKMFDGIDDVKRTHSQKKNSALTMSANEEALSTFMAKKQAEDMEHELREIIVTTRGISAWHELVKLRVEIRKQRKAEELRIQRERQERNELILVGGGAIFLLLILLGGMAAIIFQSTK